MIHRVRYLAAAGAALSMVLAGCLAEPPKPPNDKMCTVTSDCDVAAGEICDQGVCWGNPPSGLEFAAILIPPQGRDDVVVTEISSLDVAVNGQISNLVFGDYITVSGRIILQCEKASLPDLCDPSLSTEAKLFVRRGSRFPGGPRYTRTVNAVAGALPGETGFSMRLPRLQAGDAPYEITIQPSDELTNADGISPAMLAPPLRVTIEGTGDRLNMEWRLGDPNEHLVIAGRVVDAVGQGVKDLQVTAQGRWNLLSELVDASSLTTTDHEGYFSIYVPRDMVPFYDIVAKPKPGTLAPTLRAINVPVPAPELGEVVNIEPLQMPSFPQPVKFRVPVVGLDGSGAQTPVAGANVRMETVLVEDANSKASYVAQGMTDTSGVVELMLIPGTQQNRLYTTHVLSPPSSTQASSFDLQIPVGPATAGEGSVLAAISLSHRIAVSGVVLNSAGEPIEGASVSAVAANQFKLSLDAADQAKVEGLQLPSVTTDASGAFLLWLDPLLGQWEAGYDLEIVPPITADAPYWSINDVRFDPNTTGGYQSKDLKTIKLPAAAYVRGSIVTAYGETLAHAEVRLYQISTEYSICETAAPRGGTECIPPARSRGVWKADETGSVWMILPRP